MSNHSSRRYLTTAPLYQRTCLFAIERYRHRTSGLYGLVGPLMGSCSKLLVRVQTTFANWPFLGASMSPIGLHAMFNKPLGSIRWEAH